MRLLAASLSALLQLQMPKRSQRSPAVRCGAVHANVGTRHCNRFQRGVDTHAYSTSMMGWTQ